MNDLLTTDDTQGTLPIASKKELEALLVGNADLERLESLLDEFNIFEAIGAVRHELRHSDFLAYLLNPGENHGLGEALLTRLLQRALQQAGSDVAGITPVHLDLWSLDDTEVLREWQDIDILAVNERLQLVIVIENKIDSREHSNQLRRYHDVVDRHYGVRGWRIIPLFLTPDGEPPSDDRYVPFDYAALCELIESLAASRVSTIGAAVHTLITHYTQMLRRHIVSESEIAELCRSIYRKHRRALDLIYEYRPDQQEEIYRVLEELVKRTPGLILDHSSKSRLRFAIKDWEVPMLKAGKGWTPSGRMLLFEFANAPKSVRLALIIGPGPVSTRERLNDMAQRSAPPFKAWKQLYQKFNSIYATPMLDARTLEAESEVINEELRKKWERFVTGELPKIKEVVGSQDWIFNPMGT